MRPSGLSIIPSSSCCLPCYATDNMARSNSRNRNSNVSTYNGNSRPPWVEKPRQHKRYVLLG